MFSFGRGDGTRQAEAWNNATDEEREKMCRRYEFGLLPWGQTRYEADREASHESAARAREVIAVDL